MCTFYVPTRTIMNTQIRSRLKMTIVTTTASESKTDCTCLHGWRQTEISWNIILNSLTKLYQLCRLCNSLFNLSSFTISAANYRLTLGYHGISSSSLLNYISFILLNHLFLTVSKYFPKFCTCVFYLLFSLFSCKLLPYSCLTIYRVLISLSNVLFPHIPVKYVLHLLPLNIMDISPYKRSF
jgi:hypothetical protein